MVAFLPGPSDPGFGFPNWTALHDFLFILFSMAVGSQFLFLGNAVFALIWRYR
ncbi:hypothetical protein [Neolewinella xylanilytica]|uniref:hypothetical protein n=1 Tax=Neolewinella xylanilytica TaxID=1514080 RepID=UPI001474AE2F|nr:hypothetical protein [Neolewinella xylanilytica]